MIYTLNLMTVVTLTDRPKSVRNRCVIEIVGSVFVLSLDFIFRRYGGLVIRVGKISSFFSLKNH